MVDNLGMKISSLENEYNQKKELIGQLEYNNKKYNRNKKIFSLGVIGSGILAVINKLYIPIIKPQIIVAALEGCIVGAVYSDIKDKETKEKLKNIKKMFEDDFEDTLKKQVKLKEEYLGEVIQSYRFPEHPSTIFNSYDGSNIATIDCFEELNKGETVMSGKVETIDETLKTKMRVIENKGYAFTSLEIIN
ncbi:MAG: hypothetical protein N4A47_01620 [Clostridia bacterium]|jgi:hypothetical protein|nr:hypothetical protein [Clostridia bacterium]